MSHEIGVTDSMFSVRQVPWHGLGVVLEEYPTSVEDALVKSGLSWEVHQRPLYFAGPPEWARPSGYITPATTPGDSSGVYVPQLESTMTQVTDHSANVRSDTGAVLGVVGKDYKVVQNREAFAWLDTLLGTDVKFETAGSIQDGRRAWVLVTLPENVEVGGDEVMRYIFCANSHDGTLSVTAAATNIRVVCSNTLGWAIAQSEGRSYKFRHTGDLTAKMDEARKVMSLTLNWDAAFRELGNELARQNISVDTFDQRVVRPLVGLDRPTSDLGERAIANREQARDTMIDLFTGDGPNGDTTGNSPGTKWCAANAVAEYSDWYRRYTGRTDQMARSFEDHSIKQRGLELVISA